MPKRGVDLNDYRSQLNQVLGDEMQHRGIVFVAAEPIIPPGESAAQPASGRDLAHEIGHLVFGPYHMDKTPVALMFGQRRAATSLLQKRFDAGQRVKTSRFLLKRMP